MDRLTLEHAADEDRRRGEPERRAAQGQHRDPQARRGARGADPRPREADRGAAGRRETPSGGAAQPGTGLSADDGHTRHNQVSEALEWATLNSVPRRNGPGRAGRPRPRGDARSRRREDRRSGRTPGPARRVPGDVRPGLPGMDLGPPARRRRRAAAEIHDRLIAQAVDLEADGLAPCGRRRAAAGDGRRRHPRARRHVQPGDPLQHAGDRSAPTASILIGIASSCRRTRSGWSGARATPSASRRSTRPSAGSAA